MDEGQDTAVRPLKKQNDTKYRNFVSSDCRLEYRIGRTADTGRQRSDSAGRFGKDFPKKPFPHFLSIKRSQLRRQKGKSVSKQGR